MANTKSADFESSSSQYLSIANADVTGLNFTGDFTFEGWFKLESQPADGNWFTLGARRDGGTERSWAIDYKTVGSSNYFVINIADGGASETAIQTSTAKTLTAGTWYHLAFVYNASAGSCVIYVDGSSQETVTGLKTSIYDSGADTTLGARAGSRFYDGLMDEIIIWDDARTSTEISESYNSGDGKIYTGSETNMQGYWRMEDDFTDETSNNNDLTNNNSITFSTDVPFTGATTASFIPKIIMS